MYFKLNIYEDESFSSVKRVAEADSVKIPYRVAMSLINSLDGVSLEDEVSLFKLVTSSTDKLDKIIKATFGVSEAELDCVDAGELGTVAVELYRWAMDKIKDIKGNSPKNAPAAV